MLILASRSPRRRELLSYITENFEIIPARGEEKADKALPPAEYVMRLAADKASEVAAEHPDDTVIGSDTVVCVDGQLLGKPADKADAVRMLKLLSGREHSVFTGVCVIREGKEHIFVHETKVVFYPLSDREIEEYAESGEPMDKAGAYGIQGRGALLAEKIDGDYYSVMGLPIAALARVLRDIGEI